MRDLVVYYSFEGNTEYVADKICEATGADKLRLAPRKAYKGEGFTKFVWLGRSAVMAEKPELEDYSIDLDLYDRIIFGFPVWASNVTPPLRTFIIENKEKLAGKSFIAFACQSGNGAQKAFPKLAKLLGIGSFDKTEIFIDPKAKASEEKDAQIAGFCEALKR